MGAEGARRNRNFVKSLRQKDGEKQSDKTFFMLY